MNSDCKLKISSWITESVLSFLKARVHNNLHECFTSILPLAYFRVHESEIEHGCYRKTVHTENQVISFSGDKCR